MKVLMVCLGNICRSPLAQGILEARATEAGLNWEVDSAGTLRYHVNEPPFVLSQQVAKENGIDISKQRCRVFLPEDMHNFDRIYVMDGDNYAAVKKISGTHFQEKKVMRLLDVLYPGEERNVPDPYNGTKKDFEAVFQLIDSACRKIVDNYGRSAG
jgi:protein-tyrosine phosphatase